MNWKHLSTLLALPLALILTGCFVQSLYPIYAPEAKVDLPELTGDWRPADDEEQAKPVWQFKDDGTIVTCDDDGIVSVVEAVYFRVGDHLFADWTAGNIDKDAGINLYWRIHVMRTHSVLKVDLDGDRLALTPLDLEWANQSAKEDPNLLPYLLTENDDDNILFVAFPEEWEAFLLLHATNSAAFKPDSALQFIRVPAQKPAPQPE